MNGLPQFLTRINILVWVFLILNVGIYKPANSQNSNEVTSEHVTLLSEYTAKLYGTDDILVNGRKYLPEHYNAKGDPYFLSDKWADGSIVIDGKKYDELELLYDIDIEKAILKTTINDSTDVFLVLNNDVVESFYLGSHYFLNAAKHGLGNEFPGFVEQLYTGSFTVLTRHQKSFVSEYSKNTPNGFYASTKSTNYILNHGKLFKLSSKKSLFEYFTANKKEVKNFLRRNKIKYKRATFIQLNKLFEFCDEITSS